MQRIDNSNAWQEYTQEELNASVKMKLGEDLDDVVKELLPGIGGLQYSEGNIVYVIPGGGETDYQNPGEYHDDHHGYCFTRKYVASGITDKQCTNVSTQGNYVGHPTYRELTVDDKHYYSLNQNHIVDKAEIINSDGQIAVTYFDRNEDRTMDEYIKGYDRDLSDLFRLPTKFDANGSCNLVHADRGLKPVRVLNRQVLDFSTSISGVNYETLSFDHEGQFECKIAMPIGWACAEGHESTDGQNDFGGGSDEDNGGGGNNGGGNNGDTTNDQENEEGGRETE